MFKSVRRIIIRVLVFIAVAVGTAYLVNRIYNLKMDKVSTEMDESTLPIVFCEYKDMPVNLMRGYTQTMSTRLMRDGIIPLNENHGVDVLVYDDSDYGVSYSYELRSIDGESLIEHGELEPANEKGGYVEYNINFRMDTRENKEYVMAFVITGASGEEVRYYTRVVQLAEEHADAVMEFAMDFHNTTMEKEYDEEEGNLVSKLLKTTETGDDNDLSHVDLTSGYEMVSWGGLEPVVMTAIIPTISEIDREYTAISLSYVVEANTEDVEHYYNITENYSARYDKNSGEIELLAFDRYQESLFDANFITKERNGVSMGIADMDSTEYATSNNNRLLAFVKEGQLWLYNYDTTDLVTVFDLLQGKYSDVRCLNTDIDINIASLDDEGNMYFVVYGYFSRGRHEGKNGISLYYFSAKDAKIEEQCFILCDEPFEVMSSEVGRFTYYDKEGYLYYLLDGSIFRVDLERMTQDTICSGIPSNKYMVSENRKIVAYPNAEKDEDVTGLTIKNFELDIETQITGKTTDRFLALGFVGNDLIYGVADRNDIIISAETQATLPLYKLYINGEKGENIKTYGKDGIYIMDVNVTADNIYLKRAVKKNNFFEETDPDYISYKSDNDASTVHLAYNDDPAMLKLVDIVFPANMYVSEDYRPIMTKTRDFAGYKELKVDTTTASGVYYVFNNKGYEGEYRSAGRAIIAVNEGNSGIVVDSDGNTVYRKLDAISYNTVADSVREIGCETVEESLLTCAYMCIRMINGKADYEEVMGCESYETAFAEYSNGVGINISGIDLDTALYFLDRDVPFTARIDDGRYVLVISYNSTHVRYYDPVGGGEVKVTREAFSDSISIYGNTMYAYTSQ